MTGYWVGKRFLGGIQMMRRVAVGVVLLGMMAMAGGRAGYAEGASGGTPDYAAERAESAKELTQPYGWFSLVALEWLKPGVTTVGSAKGNDVVLANAPAHLVALEQKEGKVAVQAASPELKVGGKGVATGSVVSDYEREDAALAYGSLRMWAIQRGDKRYLRVKDANAPALKHFHGLRWYAPDATMRVTAKWIPFDTPHTMRVQNKLGQITPVPVPGYVEFEVGGARQTLTPMSAGEKGLFFVFRDASSRESTDGGGRFLETGAPSNGLNKPGTVVLDFNEAANPPCAYSPYATCPLASPENRMVVAVRAGEKRYED